MSIFNQPFNAAEVDTSDNFDSIPPGTYEAVVLEHETKATRSGNGQYLELTMQVISGDFENRRIWDRLNLDNPNEKAVQIAQKKFAQLVQSCGLSVINSDDDLDKLVEKPIAIVVKYQRKKDDASGKWVDDTSQTQVVSFKALSGSAPGAPAPTAATNQPPPNAQAARATTKPSWASR